MVEGRVRGLGFGVQAVGPEPGLIHDCKEKVENAPGALNIAADALIVIVHIPPRDFMAIGNCKFRSFDTAGSEVELSVMIGT